ncbi:MAG: hypothetical protein ACRDJM_01025, partial [Actinomycetota bacterium]
MSRFASVVLLHASLVHHDRVFTYSLPDEVDAHVGSLVRVPLGRRKTTGIVMELLDEADVARVLPVERTLGPGLDEGTVSLARWVAERYLSTLGEALVAALPARVASEESAVHSPGPPFERASPRPPGPYVGLIAGHGHAGFSLRTAPTPERGRILADLAASQVSQGRGALILLPEVRVRSEIAGAIETEFGDAVAWLGTDRSERDRYRAWLDLRAGARSVACGGRAAVFAPVRNLGMVIVDDEAHVSYKERRAPRFHARTVAAERARRAGATLVAVGVPPSIEVAAAVTSKRMTDVVVPDAVPRPPVRVVDLATNPERLLPSGRSIDAGAAAIREGARVVVLTHRGGDQPARLLDRAARTMR